MKRRIASIGSLCLLATPCFAQSSVSVYGILDAGVSIAHGSIGDKNSMTSGNIIASRLGFKGTEDLGGGLSTNFALEAGINNDNGTGAATNTNNQPSGVPAGSPGLAFNRQSWVGIAGAFGQLRLGRNFTPTYRNLVASDPFNAGGLGASQAALGAIAAYGHPAGLRASNGIEYWLPESHGFSGQFTYALGENPSNSGAIRDDGRYAGGRLAYTQGPFDIGAAYALYKVDAVGDIHETVLGLTYAVGAAKLYASYTRNTTGRSNQMTGGLVGARYRTGAMEFNASFSQSELENFGGAKIGTSRKSTVAAYYYLSKRSFVYALYAQNRNSHGAAGMPFAGIAVNGPNGDANVTSIGFTHTF
jgi:predicted porin